MFVNKQNIPTQVEITNTIIPIPPDIKIVNINKKPIIKDYVLV